MENVECVMEPDAEREHPGYYFMNRDGEQEGPFATVEEAHEAWHVEWA